MTARTIDLSTVRRESTRLGQRPAVDRSSNRLDVIAHDVADVISAAGGLLFDRALSGWDVSVFTTGDEDSRALRILGVNALPLDQGLGPTSDRPQAIAVSAATLAADERVRDYVAALLERGDVDVSVWGDDCPTLPAPVDPLRHRMSLAAKAFKGHALDAAAVPHGAVERDEYFGPAVVRRLITDPDLYPAG